MKLHKLMLCAACLLFMHALFAQNQPSNVLVHFAFDKYDISASDLTALKNFKDAHPNIAGITIDGYADTTGTDDYNYALSEKRCAAVKQALNYDESITEVLMRVGVHGEKDLLYKTDPENRVVIVAINDKKVREQKRIQDSIAAAALQKAKDDSILKLQQEAALAKPVVQKINSKPTTNPIMPKVINDDATGLSKILQDSKEGESFVLSEIHFEEGRHVLVKSSKPALNAILQALKDMPSLQLEIQGHMCCDDALTVDGFDIDTKEFMLSYNRAKAVFDFLVQNGIDASRLTYKGYGTRKRLVSPEKTDKDRDENRRVEFLITKK